MKAAQTTISVWDLWSSRSHTTTITQAIILWQVANPTKPFNDGKNAVNIAVCSLAI